MLLKHHLHLSYFTVFTVLRGHITRKKVVPVIRHRHEAAVKIQSHVRGHFVRKTVRQQQSKDHNSAVVIQKGNKLTNCNDLKYHKKPINLDTRKNVVIILKLEQYCFTTE